jgi:hypothetical protein
MPQDVVELVEPYRTSESSRWAKLAGNVHWRRLVVLLLREIVVELRAIRGSLPPASGQAVPGQAAPEQEP